MADTYQASAGPATPRRGRLRQIFGWFKDAGVDWLDDHAAQLGASLAYYAIFAVGPLLLIAISVAGLVFGHDAAQNQIVHTLRDYIGKPGAEMVQTIVKQSAHPSASILGTIAGVGLLLFGATAVFGQLDDALALIWHVKPSQEPGWKSYLKQRFLSLTMVLGTGFLLMVSLLVSAAATIVGKFFSSQLPGGQFVWEVINFVFQLVIISGVFALIFKLLPRTVKLFWSDVWRSALITGGLFTGGKFLLGLYIEKGDVGSAYGAAGSLIGILVWIYYAAQILFFGVELTKVYASQFGSCAPGGANEQARKDATLPEAALETPPPPKSSARGSSPKSS